MEVFIGLAVLLGLIVLGMPVGFALGVGGAISLLLYAPLPMVHGLAGQVVHHTVANYVILTIPMFVLISEVLAASGIATDLMLACNRLMRRIRGGLAMACVLAGAVLAAASGSSTASVATLCRAAFPTMRRLGYDQGFSIATISMSGTLAIMIPPSIAFVVYGIITEESIGRLFMAGLIPGLLTALGYILTITVAVRIFPHLAPALKEKLASATGAAAMTDEEEQHGRVWPVVLLVVVIMGALYSGIATPTEVGALGALGAILICVALGRIGPKAFTVAVANTLRTSAMIATIIFGALLFGKFMSLTQMTDAASNLGDPLESALQLADGNITLGQLLSPGWRMPHLVDVFLSCCETNLGTPNLTDDLLTLSTGFLCAGARSVVSTLWSVDALATALFCDFYYQFRDQGSDRPTALQQAQHKLRTLTGREFKDQYANSLTQLLIAKGREAAQAGNEPVAQDASLALAQIETYKQRTNTRIFESPYFWAGFVSQGLR